MRRIMLSALLALALPTAALADSMTIGASNGNLVKWNKSGVIAGSNLPIAMVGGLSTGAFISGTITTCANECKSLANPFTIKIEGAGGIFFFTSTLTNANCTITCDFNGGTVTFTNPEGKVFTFDVTAVGSFGTRDRPISGRKMFGEAGIKAEVSRTPPPPVPNPGA